VQLIGGLVSKEEEASHTQHMGSDLQCMAGQPKAVVDRFRNKLGEIIKVVDREPVDDGESIRTPLRPGMFGAWQRYSQDVVTEIEKWRSEGGPCGVTEFTIDKGVVPPSDKVPTGREDPLSLPTGCEEEHHLVLGSDNDEQASEEMEKLVKKEYVKRFVPSKLMVLSKVRIILNCRKSGVSGASAYTGRSFLPRILDAVLDEVELMGISVIDFTNAYWNIPAKKSERRLFTTFFRGRVYVVSRATQGSRGGPLLWARTAAISTRMAQSLREPGRLWVSTHVVDPFIAARGTLLECNVSLTMVLLTWLALGLEIAWKKAQRGLEVTGTSASIKICKHMVTAAVKADLIKVIRDSCVSFLKRNLISLKELRTFAGRAVHAASLLFGRLPFGRMLWGPLLESSAFGAPPGMVWVKQIMIPVKWIIEFLNGGRGTTSKSGATEAYFGLGRQPLGSWSNSLPRQLPN